LDPWGTYEPRRRRTSPCRGGSACAAAVMSAPLGKFTAAFEASSLVHYLTGLLGGCRTPPSFRSVCCPTLPSTAPYVNCNNPCLMSAISSASNPQLTFFPCDAFDINVAVGVGHLDCLPVYSGSRSPPYIHYCRRAIATPGTGPAATMGDGAVSTTGMDTPTTGTSTGSTGATLPPAESAAIAGGLYLRRTFLGAMCAAAVAVLAAV
jgi:hypothetical protein